MNTKVIISIVVGTLLLFVWSAVSWMVLPFHSDSLHNIPNQAFDTEKLKNLMPESGVYHYPGYPEGSSPEVMKKVEDQLAEGPRITMMVYKNAPTTLFNPMDFLISLFLNLILVVLSYYLISKMGFRDLKSILIAMMEIALVVIIVADLSQMNWFMFPLDYTFANIIDRVVSFGILGLLFGLYTFKNNESTAAF